MSQALQDPVYAAGDLGQGPREAAGPRGRCFVCKNDGVIGGELTYSVVSHGMWRHAHFGCFGNQDLFRGAHAWR